MILQDFGVVSREDVKRGRLAGVSKQELVETIYDFLLGLLPLRASAVLIIDEAQNLPMPVLEQIRILSNLETDKEKLLQIVLVGQLNLNTLLKAPEMRQLDQRVSIRYQLKPLTRDEVAAYVTHRLTIAGASAVVSFQPKALNLVHRRTGGIPRLVNMLADRSLLAAYSARANKVTPDMVEKAAESLELAAPKSSLFGLFRKHASVLVTAAGATVALAGAGGMAAPVVRAAAMRARPAAAQAAKPADKPAEMTPALPAPEPPVAGAPAQPAATAPAENHYAVMAASFPVKEVTRDGSAAAVGLDAVRAQLQALGYTTWLTDVDLKARGEWRRVLIGEFDTLDEAMQLTRQLRQSSTFSDAQPIRY
jgi:general secretion pathway protein A